MWILVTAVVTASLLGSMHCVGMCGPLAIWATGAGDKLPKRTVMLTGTLYHLGRLTTYLIAGLIAGAIGSMIDLGGQWIGFQVGAARLVGGLMVAIGLWKLWSLAQPASVGKQSLQPSYISGLLVKLRPYLFRLPITGRAFGTGLLTTLLPCGWLYLFALFAAGTGSMLMGPVVMLAFWIGTVPALTSLIAGTRLLSQNFTVLIPTAAAVMLIVAGGYTASGRGFAELDTLASLRPASLGSGGPRDLVKDVQEAATVPLPCCLPPGASGAGVAKPVDLIPDVAAGSAEAAGRGQMETESR